MPNQPLANPFSIEGAKRISELTGQKLATAPVDVSTLTGGTTIQTPPLQTTTTYTPSSIVLPPIQNTTKQDALETGQDQLLSDIEASTTKLGTKTARKTQLETDQGIPQLNKDIQELYDQANQIDAAAVNMNARSEDRLAPMFAIRGEQASIDRQAAAKKAGIAAIATAKQGKLALAQDYVTQALAAEFDPEEAKIEHKKFLLSINMDRFEGEEKRRAEERLEQLNVQKDALADARTNKAGVLDIMLAAAQNGADNTTLTRIQASPTPEAALATAGEFVRDPDADLKTSLLKEQILTQRQSRENAATNNLIERAKLGDARALQQLGITPSAGGKVRVDQKEAAAINKEIAGNDTYKAMDKAAASWRALKEYEKLADQPTNPILDPIDSSTARSTYNTALLQLKEYYNLGVLNGPDLDVMQRMVPSVVKGVVSTAASLIPIVGGLATDYITRAQVKSAIANQKVQFEDKLDSDYLTLKNQYSAYDPSQVTNLADIDRKYLQMKTEINPQVAKFLADNPDLPLDEQLQVINTRL